MNLLFILPHPLVPPDRGNKHHTLNLLRHIAREHDCDVLGFEEPGRSDPRSWKQLAAELPRVRVLEVFSQVSGRRLRLEQTRCVTTGLPPVFARYRNRQLEARLRRMDLSRYDLVCFDMYTMAEQHRFCEDRPSVLIASDAYSLMLLRTFRDVRGLRRRGRTLAELALQLRVERTLYPHFDVVSTVSSTAAEWLTKVNPRTVTEVVQVPADEAVLAETAEVHPDLNPPRVICWELLSNDGVARAVAEFVDRSWGEVRRAVPDAELLLWGKDPHSLLAEALRAPGVRYLDFAEDCLAVLRQGAVFLFPHRCTAGMHLKLFSAMAVGLPAVTAPESCGWFDLKPSENAMVCRTQSEFAAACVELLRSPERRARMGANARTLIRREFTSARLGEKMLAVFKNAIARHAQRH